MHYPWRNCLAHLQFNKCNWYYSALFFLHSSSSTSSSPRFPYFASLLKGQILYSRLLQIHAQIYEAGAHQNNLIASRLIGQYPPHFGFRVFHQLQQPNILSFNAIIRVMAEKGSFHNAFIFYKSLQQHFLLPNDFTFSFLLKACCNARIVIQIHVHIIKMNYIFNSFVCNGLLNAYVKGARDMVSGHKLFDEFPEKSSTVHIWTSLIASYAKSGQYEEALELFILMVNEKFELANDTMISVLSACSCLNPQNIEKWVVNFLSLISYPNKYPNSTIDSINTVLVYLYGKWGKVDHSRGRFDEIIDYGRSVLPWNAMIGAYERNGWPREALSIFHLMLNSTNCIPNHVTMVSVLSACAETGDLDLGNWVFHYMQSNCRIGIVESNTLLGTAFIEMYSRCGSLGMARCIFDRLLSKDVVSFNAMIMGFAINGEGKEALNLFYKMHKLGLNPNSGTFLSALCACSHSGLLKEGRRIFSSINPKSCETEHYASYIGLLSKAGLFEEALEVIGSMPHESIKSVGVTFLSGCILHNKFDLASDISKKLFELDPENSGGYVLMSNAFAAGKQWNDVSGIRVSMKEKGMKKHPGFSWIGINGMVHEFVAGLPSHPQIESIYQILNELMKEMKVGSSLLCLSHS